MADMAFNTIAEIQRLRDAGFEQTQAEAITLSIHAGVTGGVATKADLELVRAELGGQIAAVAKDLVNVKTELEGRIEKQGAELRTEIATQGADLQAKINQQGKDLGEKIAALGVEVAKARTELGTEIANVRTELGTEIANVRTELGTEIANVRTELGTEIANVRTELGTGVANVRTEVADLRTLIATGQAMQLRWMIGLAVVMTGVLVTALTL